MTTVFPAIQDLARRIVAVEAARAAGIDGAGIDPAVRVCEKLQVPLSRLTGPVGFSSLLSRAVALAKAEVPALSVVQVQPDGSVAGFDAIDAGGVEQGRLVLAAQLLGLLATFIGESLTRRLAYDVWPDASIDSTEWKRAETS